jgi:predicted alpha/beta hydrolase family esterase
VAAWAAHSQNTHLVKAALLVAPPDTAREDIGQMLPGWRVALQQLPFKSVVFASSDDPFCGVDQAQRFAAGWGATSIDIGKCGHINADSGLGDWPAAHAELQQLMSLNG